MTGYALPAQSIFVCPPLSLRIKGDNVQPTRRLTYCVTKCPELAIQLFAERPGHNGSPHPDLATKSRALSESQSPIKLLDSLSTTSTSFGSHLLLCVQEDGHIMALPENLEGAFALAHMLGRDRSQEMDIISAAVMTVEAARSTILFKRGDIGARLQPETDTTVSRVLLTLSQDSKARTQSDQCTLTFRLISMIYTCDKSPNISCEELLSARIQSPPGHSIKTVEEFFLDDRTGDLYYHSQKCFTRFKFDGLRLRTFEHMDFDLPIDSYLQLGPHNVATSTGSIVSIASTVFKSLLSRQMFTRPNSKETGGQPKNDNPTLRLCSYVPSLNSAVAIHDSSLVSVPLENESLDHNSNGKRHREGTLVGSIGRGLGLRGSNPEKRRKSAYIPPRFGKLLRAEIMSEEWEKTCSRLQQFAEVQDDTGFDEIINDEFRTNDTRTDQKWEELRLENLQKIKWVICSLFKYGPSTSKPGDTDTIGLPALRIHFLPHKTYKWLVQCNALSSQQVELALKAYGKMPATASLPADALVSAISSYAQGSRHLSRLLFSKCPLSPDEIGQALRYALERVEKIAGEGRVKLQNGEHHQQASSELAGCFKAIDKSDLGSRTKVFYTIMQRCLRLLQDLDPVTIQLAFKRSLTTSQLRILVDCLRRDLACGGWLSNFTPGETPFFLSQPDEGAERLIRASDKNQEIAIIVKFYNCVIDALGMTSWISTDADSIDSNVLTYMKAEVSAALEGIEEAAYVEGILSQTLLYGKRAGETIEDDKSLQPKLDSNDKTSLKTRAVNWGLENGMEKVLRSEQGGLITQDDPTRADTSLPLDLRLNVDKVGETKVGTGSMVEKRSVRETELLKRQRVGDYQFERIII